MLLSNNSCQKSESKSTLGVHISNLLKNVQSHDECIYYTHEKDEINGFVLEVSMISKFSIMKSYVNTNV